MIIINSCFISGSSIILSLFYTYPHIRRCYLWCWHVWLEPVHRITHSITLISSITPAISLHVLLDNSTSKYIASTCSSLLSASVPSTHCTLSFCISAIDISLIQGFTLPISLRLLPLLISLEPLRSASHDLLPHHHPVLLPLLCWRLPYHLRVITSCWHSFDLGFWVIIKCWLAILRYSATVFLDDPVVLIVPLEAIPRHQIFKQLPQVSIVRFLFEFEASAVG
jgi:hypothetical protein